MPGGMFAVLDLFWLTLAVDLLCAVGNFIGGRSGVYRYVLWGEETFAHDFSELGAVYRSYAPICYARPSRRSWLGSVTASITVKVVSMMMRSLRKAASCLGARGEWAAAHDLFGTSGCRSDSKVYG